MKMGWVHRTNIRMVLQQGRKGMRECPHDRTLLEAEQAALHDPQFSAEGQIWAAAALSGGVWTLVYLTPKPMPFPQY